MKRVPYFWAILALSIIVLISSGALRMSDGNHTLAGEYSYKYLAPFQLSDFFSSALFVIPSHFGYYWMLVVIESLLLFILFYRLLTIHTANVHYILASCLLFVLAPSSVYLSSVISPYLTSLLLILATLNILNSRYYWFSTVSLLGLALFDWLVFLVTLCVVIMYSLYHKLDYFRFAGYYAILFGIVQLVFPRPFLLEIVPPHSITFQLFSDFGGTYGIGLFTALLALMGFIGSWTRKKQLAPAYVCALIILGIAIFVTPEALLFLAPLVVLFAAFGLQFLWERTWVFPILRFLTLTAVLYGVLFSSLAYINHVRSLPPDIAVFESMTWIKEHSLGVKNVLSHPQKGFWIAYGSDATPNQRR